MLERINCTLIGGKLSYNMADKTELVSMNLAAIKRVDPYAKNIVGSSPHVAFYTFNPDENEWEKTDVEGAFFIYNRNAEPMHSIFINNRLNTNSFVEPITGLLELQSQPPFLLYRNERSRIRGFWFYNSSECDRIGNLVGQLIKVCEGASRGMSKQKNEIVDIFSMLSKAQEDFNNSQNIIVQKSDIKSRPVNQPDIAFPSVIDFFASAKPAAASEVPIFHRLLSNPVSVNEIEKQQRAATPQEGRISPFANSSVACDSSNLGPSLAKFLYSNSTVRCEEKPIVEIANAGHQNTLEQLLKNDSSAISSPSKPALMPPTVFEQSSLKNSIGKTGKSSQIEQMSTSMKPTVTKPEPLTQTQLIQAIIYLMQNDPDFVKKLHEAYLKSFSDMVSL